VGGRRSSCQLIVVVVCVALAGCGGHTQSQPNGSGATATAAQSKGQSATTSTSTATGTGTSTVTGSQPSSKAAPRRPPPRPDPCPPRSAGALPQTERVPSATTPCFHAIARALWRGVRGNSPRALYAFFPLQAYEQVKTIGDPAGDYRDRLIAEYDLDMQAAHQLLGRDPAAARLVTVMVPGAYVHWVPPGACDNRIGYYEVPNSRLVYRVGADVRSLGIASLISWRGIWYVVHLGAVVRSGYGGVVDDPSDGTGAPAPSLTC
jgi:hypothetical protein